MEAALISHRAYSSICVFCGKGRALFTSDSVCEQFDSQYWSLCSVCNSWWFCLTGHFPRVVHDLQKWSFGSCCS